MPSFSFVMPAYKAKFLSKAINSILKQDYNDFELIIVNDASPENLKHIVNEFRDKRIRYNENKLNIGGNDLVKNWNSCVSLAENDFVVLATDDDIFDKDYLSNAAKLIEKYPDVDLIRSGVKKIDEYDNIIDFEFPTKEFMTAIEFMLYYAKGGTISCVSNYIIKKTSLDRLGGFISFPRAHYSDDATALALSKNGVACMPTNSFSFRVSNINLSNRRDYLIVKEQLKATEQYMGWYINHIKEIGINPGSFFEKACYGGYKSRYLAMTENLISKIPFTKVHFAIHYIIHNNYMFKKEKIKMLFSYLICHS